MYTTIRPWAALLVGLLAARCGVKEGGAGAPAGPAVSPVPEGPRVVSDFDLTVRPGEGGIALVFTYRGKSALYNPACFVLLYNQNRRTSPRRPRRGRGTPDGRLVPAGCTRRTQRGGMSR